jgi:hypothetical protein
MHGALQFSTPGTTQRLRTARLSLGSKICSRTSQGHHMLAEVNEGKYSIELFRMGGEGKGPERVLDRDDNLSIARAVYRGRVEQYPGRLIMLCDRARVLARSDRPETLP